MLDIVHDAGIAWFTDLIEQLQHRIFRDVIGNADGDLHRLIVDGVNVQFVDAMIVDGDLELVHRIDKGRFEMQARRHRLCRMHRAKPAHARHLGRLHDEIAVAC